MIMYANDLFKAVMEIDLEPIKTKLMHVPSGEGWSLEKTNAVEKEYRRFLCLMKLYPEEDTAPLEDVDTFWHYHILDTMKYARDCEHVFGYFLHHYPYVGLEGTEGDEQFRLDSGDRMRQLYEATFGDAYPGSSTKDIAALAFCAGPSHDKVQSVSGAVAFCAGPSHDKVKNVSAAVAFCAGPSHDKVKNVSGAVAFCAGPSHDKVKNVSGAVAFCAGPSHDKVKNVSAAVAFCAGPSHDKVKNVSGAVAFCAGPSHDKVKNVSAAVAFCAGPSHDKVKAHAKNVSGAVAFCAGPSHDKVKARTAQLTAAAS
jgi:hypothetical protein